MKKIWNDEENRTSASWEKTNVVTGLPAYAANATTQEAMDIALWKRH